VARQDDVVADTRSQYRQVIDELVRTCREGQGQIASRRIRKGIWNPNDEEVLMEFPEQIAMNSLLMRLDAEDRELLARFFAEQFVGGVHESLAVIHAAQIASFNDGYEGTPYNDFVGRLEGWPWPQDER
jgi:hypothetical protein